MFPRIVDGDVQLFQDFEHTHVGAPRAPPAAEHQAYLRFSGGGGEATFLRTAGIASGKNQRTDHHADGEYSGERRRTVASDENRAARRASLRVLFVHFPVL